MTRVTRSSIVLTAALTLHCGSPQQAPTVPPPPAPPGPAQPPPATAAPAQPPRPTSLEPPQPTLRLPRNFVPTGYTARLVIDPKRPTFDGEIAIAGTVTERSSVIWLHGYHLAIARAAAQRGGAEVGLTVTPRGDDLLELRAARPLEPGAWTLALDYTGELDAVNTAGAFRQAIGDHAYVYTQLEAIYARRVFPCLDEPDVKVPWKLTLDVPKQLTVVGNTLPVGEAPLDDRTKRVELAPTKPLPSYLVAFGVGPFEIVEAGATKRGTPVRVIALARRAGEAAYAAKTAPRIIEIAEEWFGTPYPYEKLDLMAIPVTSGFGAMENAGLITFSETLILLDPVRASRQRQHEWGVVAAHEIAHQWFGNLVTAAFWDDIWLNEGFANWIERKLAAQLEPAWRDDQAVLDTRELALHSDSLVSARQIRQPVETTDDILNAFDPITYDKGASVLGMFERYLGADVFQRGVRDHLAARAWGNATSADFAAAIGRAAGPRLAALGAAPDAAAGAKLIEAAFASFLDQPGAPELTATLACGASGATAQLAQRRFVPPGAPTPAPGVPWKLPVCVAYDRDGARAEACGMLTGATGAVALPAARCPRWVMPNAGGSGYYRNAYTPAQILALRDEAWPSLSWLERRALYADVALAARHGRLSLQLALSLVPRMLAGGDRFTTGPALGLAIGLRRLVPARLHDKYEHYLRQTFGPAAAQAGFLGRETDSLDAEESREQLIEAVALHAREPQLVAEASRLVVAGWRNLPQPMRGVALAVAADARADVFDRLLRDVHAETDRARREELYRALAGVRDPARQRSALALLLDPQVDVREAIDVLFAGATDANLAVAQQFFRDHKDALLKRLPTADTAGPLAYLSYLFTATCRADQREAVTAYVTQIFAPLPGGARVVRQNLEAMDQCIAARALLEPEVTAWLQGMRKPAPEPAKAAPKAPAQAPKAPAAKSARPAKPAKPGRAGGRGP